MTTYPPGTIVERQEFLGSRVDTEMVFFDQMAGKYFATGPVGADIWDLLESSCTIGAICSQLLGKYEVDPATCAKQVGAFVEQMRQAGLLAVRLAGET